MLLLFGMEFGKLNDISTVNWDLPRDDARNELRLTSASESKLFFGSPSWSNKHWRGKIYPQNSSPEEFLHYYSRNFNCIELNTTHYRIPTSKTVNGWLSHVPLTFQLCPKVYKEISHSKFGLGDKTLLKEWMNFLEGLGENRGPCFIQFHELFSYAEKVMLFKFLESWPKEFELTLEFRHPSWFEKNTIRPALADYLHKKKMGLVITDVAGRRDVLHTTLTAPWTMIRLIGNDLDASDEFRIMDWATRIQHWQSQGIERTYLFLHQPDDHWTIEFARLAERIFMGQGFRDLPHFELPRERDLLTIQG